MKKRTNVKTINLVCYLTSDSEVLERIRSLPFYRYAFIKHDKDLDESGQAKKLHYHVLVCMRKAVNVNTIANLFGVAPNLVDTIGDPVASFRYLIHLDNIEKYQYSSLDIIQFGSWSSQFETYTFQDLIKELKFYISDSFAQNKNPSFLAFVEGCINSGFEHILKKNYFIVKDLFIMTMSESHK